MLKKVKQAGISLIQKLNVLIRFESIEITSTKFETAFTAYLLQRERTVSAYHFEAA